MGPPLQSQSESISFGVGPPLQGDFVRRVVPRPAPTRGRGTSMCRSDEIPLHRRPSPEARLLPLHRRPPPEAKRPYSVRIVLVAYNTATFKAYQQALAVAAQAHAAVAMDDHPLPSFAR